MTHDEKEIKRKPRILKHLLDIRIYGHATAPLFE